jgi:2-polyprenyl-3-methyl-5-hydroxy-6-metoxy-1,4-benzoquinol methylase
MSEALRTLARRLLLRFELAQVAKVCKQNFIKLNREQEDALIQSLVEHYYLAQGKGDPRTSPDLKDDLDDAVYGTVIRNRTTVIPWLNSIFPLTGVRILEIGTGAGGSIVPLAEQGAYVVGTDVDADSLAVAKDRIRIYGLEDRTEIHLTNAADLQTTFPDQRFDVVIFYASLEHMTLEERWSALPAAWNLLNRGGRLVIIQTPNRLWWYDGHTSNLPFYHWLPDDVAFRYRGHSQRKVLSELSLSECGNMLPLVRLGRAASYHEFQIALPGLDLTQVESSMRIWLRRRNPMRLVRWYTSGNAGFQRFLRRAGPGMHVALFEPYLNFAIRKP